MLNKNNLSILLYILLISSCAQVVAPSGGPMDLLGPKIVDINPINKTTKFDLEGKTIKIKFDEFIKLKDESKQIIISPPLKKNPEYLITGKELKIIFNEKLDENTTYTINFGNSIIDNHEGKNGIDLKYIFSTGDYIDSNYVSGKVINAFTGLPSEGVNVCLYKKKYFTDSTLLKMNPNYFTKTLQDGSFKLENLPIDEYELYAYKKEGTNLKYVKNDSIAFINNSVNTQVKEENIKLFLYKNNEFKINKLFDTISNQTNVYNFVFYKPNNIIIKSLSDNYYIKNIKGKDNKDTIKVFVENYNNVNTFNIKSIDTSYNLTIKTKNKSKINELVINSKIDINPLDTQIIDISNPFKIYNIDSIIFKEDTIVVKPIYFKKVDNFTFKLYHNWKENTSYTLQFKDSSIIDIFKNYNKSTTFNIKIKPFKEYGSLILNVELEKSNENYILQLLNKQNDAIIKEYIITDNKQIKIDYINPVEAKIKIIEDKNKNGVWDNGDIEMKKMPERVFNYKQVFNIRAYWELEQNININSIIN